MSSNTYNEVKLGDVCEITKKSVNPQKNPHKTYKHFSLPAFDNAKQPEIQLGEEIKSNKIVVENGTILFNKLNVRFKRIWNIDLDNIDDDCICSTEYIPLKPTHVYKNYLYYVLTSEEFTNKMIGGVTGTSNSHQRISPSFLLDTRILLPSYPEQKSIADTLSSIDDKIELNNRINRNIERMTQAMFKSWFVDFDPFQDGEFEDSELGKIPKGWDLKAIYDFAEYINGTSFKKNEYADSGYPIVKIAELKNGITSATQYFSGTKDEKYYIQNGDILFSWSGNPQTSIDIFIWADGDAILNQHTFKISIKNNDYSFVYLLLKYFKPEFTRIATSKQTTGLGHVTIGDLKRLKFPFDNKIVTEFCNMTNPIIQMYMKNLLENKKLIAVRDSLLPKLLSGEIRVPVEEVQ